MVLSSSVLNKKTFFHDKIHENRLTNLYKIQLTNFPQHFSSINFFFIFLLGALPFMNNSV